MNPIGIFAKTFPGRTAASVLTSARVAGYQCVEFNLACCGLPAMPDRIEATTLQSIVAAGAETGIAIAALTGTYNMIHPDSAVRRLGLTRLSHLLAHAKAMGAGLVTLCTGTHDPRNLWHYHPDNEGPEAWSLLLAEMEQAAALAAQFDVDLGIEPHLANVVATSIQAALLLKDIRSPHLRIVLDPANIILSPQADQDWIFAEAVELLSDRIAIVHAKDRGADGSAAASGQGIIDFPLFFQHLRSAGFTGPVITHGLPADDAPRVARFLGDLIAA